MKKVIKWFSIFAVIGTAVGLAVAYFLKNDSDSLDDDDTGFTEDEDFDLDADLQPASGREYVSLKKDSKESEEVPSEEKTEDQEAEEQTPQED